MVGAGRDHAEHLVRAGVLTPAEGECVVSFIEARLSALDRGHLLHGDVQPAHIFVQPSTGKLTGLIDFGDRQSGDPEWELSWVRLRENERFIRALVEGYREAGGKLNDQTLEGSLALRLLWLICRRIGLDRVSGSDISAMRDRLLALLRA
jgi:aminoglycoside phosphotransferase (APT) family kinase protein